MSFESVFFGPGNLLEWQKIVDRELPPAVLLKLDPFLESVNQLSEPAILPRTFQDGSVAWYILPSSARIARFSRDEIRGFLGLSYSLSDGLHTRLDPQDDIDRAVLEKYGTGAFKVYVPQSLREVARERVLTYLGLRHTRPARLRTYARSASRVLRDFEYAILAGSYEQASERVEELRLAGHLSATNLLFLQVRALAAAHKWEEIYNLAEMDTLLNVQRPLRVTESLIRAVYITQLQSFEDDFLPQEGLAGFVKIYDRFRDLYKVRLAIKGDEIDASFLLGAIAADPVRSELAKTILATASSDSPHARYLSALGSLLPASIEPVSDPLLEAQKAFGNGDVDKAIERSLEAPPSFERTVLLLRCAREAGTLSATTAALDSLATLSELDLNRLRGSIPTSKIIADLESLTNRTEATGQAGTDVLTGWIPWLERLRQPSPWGRAFAVAEAGSREWDTEDLAANAVEVGLFAAGLLDEKPAWAQAVFRDVVPFIVDFITLSGGDTRFRQVYENLFLLVAMDEQMSASQIQVLTRLADVLLELGLSQSKYDEIVMQLKDILQVMTSPSVIDSFLDVCESLISHPCLSPDARIGIFASTAAALARWHRRITSEQLALFRNLCEELGHSFAVAETTVTADSGTEKSLGVELLNQRLAIYSLQENSSRRAASLLREMVPGLRVEIFNDHVGGSSALRNAAQQFDFFVIVTAAAKHPATNFIEDKRPKEKPTLYANGQGSSSIFQALNSYFAVSPA